MTDISGWPVEKKMCPSCPFRETGDRELADKVLNRTLFQASQICHHPVLKGKKEHSICRGARNVQLLLLYRIGWIEAATDASFEKKSREMLKLKEKKVERRR